MGLIASILEIKVLIKQLRMHTKEWQAIKEMNVD